MPVPRREPAPRVWCEIKCWGCAAVAAYSFTSFAAVRWIENQSPLWCRRCFRAAERREARAARAGRPSRRRSKKRVENHDHLN